jgi:hypothetical protein
MVKSLSCAEQAVERILELSANLQIKRRAATKYSLEFHDYSVAIAAYGEVLEVLTALQREERYSPNAVFGSLEYSPEPQAAVI